MRMRYIAICGLPHSAIFFHIIWQTAGFSEKKLLNIKCVFWFCEQILFEIFLILGKAQSDITTKAQSDITTKAQSDITTKAQSVITTKAQSDITTKAQSDITTKAQSDITRKAQSDITTKAQSDITTNALRSSCTIPDSLVGFSCNLIAVDRFRRLLKYKISWKFVQWERSCSMQTDGRTDRQIGRS